MQELRDVVPKGLLAAEHNPTIRSRLIALIAIIVVPLLAMFGWLANDYAKIQRSLIETQRSDAVTNLTSLLDREIASIKGGLIGLASSDDLALGNIEDFSRHALALCTQPQFFAIRAYNHAGNLVASTQEPDSDAAFKESDQKFLATVLNGQPIVSDVVLDDRLKKAVFSVAVPAYHDGVVTHAVIATILPDRMINLFAESGIRPNWIAAIVDRNGRFVSRSLHAEQYVGQLARPEVTAAAQSEAAIGEFENVTLEGVPTGNSFRHSQLTGWTAVVAVPTVQLAEPFKRTMMLLLLGGAVVSLFSIAIASLMAARISEPVRSLSNAAVALVEGRPLPETPYRIAELSEVQAAFEHSIAKSAHLAAIIASSGDAILSTDLNGIVRSWNHGAEELYGFSAAEMIGRRKSVIVPPDRQDEFQKHIQTVGAGENLRVETARQTRDGQRIDVSLNMAPIRGPNGKIVGISSIAHDISERRETEKHQRFLMREITHRSKNLLAIVQSMSRQTSRSSRTLSEYETIFTQRLQSLAASHDILIKENWVSVALEDLVRRQLDTFVEDHDERILLSGPDIRLNAKATQALGLALHELGTNTLKYGALSVPTGIVSISWRYLDGTPQARRIEFKWQEAGGPEVTPPTRRGFGRFVIERMMADALSATVRLEYPTDGLVWTIDFPAASNLVAEAEPDDVDGAVPA